MIDADAARLNCSPFRRRRHPTVATLPGASPLASDLQATPGNQSCRHDHEAEALTSYW